MAKKYNRTLTDDYPVCMHGDCPMADKCLHRKAFSMLTETSKMLRLINPTLCSKDERCEFYRSDAPVIFARGFEDFRRACIPSSMTSLCEL